MVWETLWNQIVDLTLFAVLLRVMTPILLSALGGLISEIGGTINIGLEGLMLLAAFSSIAAGSATGSWVVAVLTGVAVAMLVSAVMGFFSLKMNVDIIIAGFAVNLFGSGFTIFLMSKIYGLTGNYSPADAPRIPTVRIPLVEDVPVLGKLLSGHNLMVWIALLSVWFCIVLIYKTPYGVHLRAVGQAPKAAQSLGISVVRIKFTALLWSGAFAGLAGSFLSNGLTNMFVKDMTGGTGFLALAVVLLGNRNPIGVLIGSVVFGLASAIATIVQTIPGSPIPSQFIQLIPYVVTILALVFFALQQKRLAALKP
jgi:simple sugar transport system permease protein